MRARSFFMVGLALLSIASLLFARPADPTSTAAHSLPSPQGGYEDSAEGLKRQIQDLVSAAQSNNNEKLAELTKAMILPNPNEWFSKTFGPEWGEIYARIYKEQDNPVDENLARALAKVISEGYTFSRIDRFENSCDLLANDDEYPALAARAIPVPLSVARFTHIKSVYSLEFLAYVDGEFRAVGLLRAPAALYPGVGKAMTAQFKLGIAPLVLNVPPGVVYAKILKHVQPRYPEEMSKQRVEDQVILHTFISAEGTVSGARVMKGECPFARAAVEAVKQWRFSPTLVQGQRVAASTTFEINFLLTPH